MKAKMSDMFDGSIIGLSGFLQIKNPSMELKGFVFSAFVVVYLHYYLASVEVGVFFMEYHANTLHSVLIRDEPYRI